MRILKRKSRFRGFRWWRFQIFGFRDEIQYEFRIREYDFQMFEIAFLDPKLKIRIFGREMRFRQNSKFKMCTSKPISGFELPILYVSEFECSDFSFFLNQTFSKIKIILIITWIIFFKIKISNFGRVDVCIFIQFCPKNVWFLLSIIIKIFSSHLTK